MPRPKSENEYQVAFKIPSAWVDSADELARGRSQGGFTTTRTEVLRAALKTGLERLELEAAADGAVRKRSRGRMIR